MKQILITDHAKEAMRERIKCSPSKYEKIARKAWESEEPIQTSEVPNQRFYQNELYKKQNMVYRKLIGKIFVFNEMHSKAILVTCFRPAVGVERFRQKNLKELNDRRKRNEKFKSQRILREAYGKDFVS